eukprot:Gb_19409 [translate_table: standard]
MGLFLSLLLNIILALLCSSCSGDVDVQRQVHVGVILHLDWFGNVAKTAFQLAAEDVNKDDAILNNTRLQLHLVDSRGDPIKAASAELSVATKVPMISLSATNPLLSLHRYPYFLRMANSDSKQMKAIAALIEAYGWREVVVVYTDNDYGTGVLSSLSECLRDVGSEIEYRSGIPPLAEASVVREQLLKLMSMRSRVFVVHMTSDVGATLFWEAQKIGMMSGDYVYQSSGCLKRLYYYLYAWRFGNQKLYSQIPQVLRLLRQTNFNGVSGSWRLREGERAHSVYEIVNVIGKSYRVLGYWSNERGLSKRATPTNSNEETWKPYDVIWPDGSSQFPRGWETPTNSNDLKIGVPVDHGFEQYISIRLNETTPSGFVIDVFDSVLRRLRYSFLSETAKKFDAVVADVTILANRSNYVDFTQPFSESGLVMVVPIRKSDSSNAWAFMRPFTPDMWCGTGAFFLFTGVVVWLLEHKRNTSFRGKPKKQVVTLLCVDTTLMLSFAWFRFSFSTMFFSQRERIVSSLGRLVVIIWLFVVLILTSSYTASLTSILTVQQMEPTIEHIDSLKASKMPIGYHAGSFVRDYLQKQLGIDKNELMQRIELRHFESRSRALRE